MTPPKVTRDEMLAVLATLLKFYVLSGQHILQLDAALEGGTMMRAIRSLIERAEAVDELIRVAEVALYKIKEMADMGMPGALSISYELSAALAAVGKP